MRATVWVAVLSTASFWLGLPLSTLAQGFDLSSQTGLVISNSVRDGEITTDDLAGGSVTLAKLSDEVVNALTFLQVGSDDLELAAVLTKHIGTAAITSNKIAETAIRTVHIDDQAITTEKIQNGAVKSIDLANNAVTTQKLSDQAITAAKIASGAVSATHLAAGLGSGDITAIGDCASGNCFDGASGTELIFNDADGDATLTIANLSAARTFTLPDSSGTLILSGHSLTGDVTATLGSSGSTALTVANDAVELGADTTGNYVATLAAGTGLTGSASSEGATPTLALNHLGLEDLSDPNSDQIVFWDDSSGNASFLSLGSNLTISDTSLAATDTQNTLDEAYDEGGAGLGRSITADSGAVQINATTVSGFAAEVSNDGNNDNRYGLLLQAGQDTPGVLDTTTLIQFNDGDGTNLGSLRLSSLALGLNTLSDQRLKHNITPTSLSLEDLLSIPVRDFKWRSDPSQQTVHGLVAQEVATSYPSAVTLGADGYLMLDQSKLIPLLVKAIQELHDRILELEQQ